MHRELFGFKKKKVYNTSNNKFVEVDVMICPNCKHENDEDARFCENCGTKLVQENAVMNNEKEESTKEEIIKEEKKE